MSQYHQTSHSPDLPLQSAAQRALCLIDLTSLNADDTDVRIVALCHQANTAFGRVAALCVYPRFVALAKAILLELRQADVLVATVVNFPDGGDDIAAAAAETRQCIEAGADEVDVVFPYRALMAGKAEVGAQLVAACKQACGGKTLKVIIESGELATPELVLQASKIAIGAGADFIKTSTGKVAINATLEAAGIMLNAIKETGGHCGFKAAGGVKTVAEAAAYLALADRIMGAEWVKSQHFRFGASSLLGSLLAVLNDKTGVATSEGY